MNKPKFRQTFKITTPSLITGGVIENNRCISVAPVTKYMKGWSKRRIIQYCAVRDWNLRLS